MSDENGTTKVIEFATKAEADALRETSLRALVIKGASSPVLDTRGISNPWDTYGGSDEIIEPPLNPDGLIDMVELSTELPTNIAAMEVNIPGFGWRVKRLPGVEDSPEVEKEKAWVDEFVTYVDYDELSFTNLRRRSRKEIETTGNWYWEVLRDATGRPCSFRLIPSNTMRMTKIERESVPVDRMRPTGSGNDRKLKTVQIWRRFKRFVQARYGADPDEPELVFFREYGDPRQLDWRTGKYGDDVEAEYRATEILHFRIYSARTPYGVPRWIGAILTASGLRAGEEINFVTFKNNNVPSLALLVSNGQLTQATIDRLTEFMEANIQGDDNWSKIVVIEALGGDDDDPEGATVKLDIKPLTNAQHTDALFQNYDKQGREKIRRMFRLPPIFTGATDEYNRACYSADTETLTEVGWRKYWEVEPGERIATFNPVSGGLEYHEPVGGLHLYDYDGPMFHFRNRNTDVLVTPDHRMWFKPDNDGAEWRTDRAEDIESNRFRFRSSPDGFEGWPVDETVEIPEMVLRDGPNAGIRSAVGVPVRLWAEFVAAFVADGATTPEFVNGVLRRMYNVQMSAKKPRKVELFRRLYDAFEKLGFRVFEPSTDADGKTTFCLADKVLWRILRALCGTKSTEKRLPLEFVRSYPSELLNLVLETLQATDGTRDHRRGRKSWAYSTSSTELADQVQIIALKLGHRAKRIVTIGDAIRHDNYRVLVVPGEREHRVTLDQLETPWYTGKVYCFEVPNHLFVTRRKGTVTIQGNTADTSRKLADEQVFDPERRDEDWIINRVLIDMGMRFHRFETNTPNVTNDQDLIAVMQGAEKAGGMTPTIARIMLEDILGRELGPVNPGINPDVPFSMSMAEAVKNLAKPNEPGQQVTALKAAARTLGLHDEWVAALDLVELANGEGVGGPRADVVLNVGSQAGDIAAGTQPVYLSSVALGLDGRELAISDGATAVAKVRFGTRTRLPIDSAAKAAGLDVQDVGEMFPGRFELWALPIEAREKFDEPIEYDHPRGSVFGFLVL